ncbi:MAG: hypothetical protein WCG34_09025 [Leptolinea sp.]
MLITTARELLSPHQSAIVFFTHGQGFNMDNSGEGETGSWLLSPELVNKVDKVIVYLRDDIEKINHIYMGDFHSLRKGDRSRRWIVRFNNITELGTTYIHWLQFGNGSTAPVNYVENA